MSEEIYPLAGMKIGVFGKGGSGKSTVSTLLAQTLQDRGYEVYLLDADSTNVGLHRILGVEEAPAALMEYLGGTVFRGGPVTCPVDDPTRLANVAIQWSALPEAYRASNTNGIHYLVADKIGGQGPGAGCDGPVAKIARDLVVQSNSDCAVTLVDFKAGFEDLARGAITGLDWAIVVVDPTNASIQIAADMQMMVTQIQAGELPATEHLESSELVALANDIFVQASIKGFSLVLNRVTDEQVETYLLDKLEGHGLKSLGTIHSDPAIAMAWLQGTQIDSVQAKQEAQAIVRELETAIAAHRVKAQEQYESTETVKIAVITEDGNSISMHFGRAPYYLVFTVEDSKIVNKERRDKVGHHQFAHEAHDAHDDPRGHGFGSHSEMKHQQMIGAIQDCAVIIVRGMGRGAYLAMEQANVHPFVTDIENAEEAVRAYLDGRLVDHTDRLH